MGGGHHLPQTLGRKQRLGVLGPDKSPDVV
jgi:hypothetical protein